IVGGGPVGLSAALLCARAGVRCLLIESRRSIRPSPRAAWLNLRTIEILRRLDLEQAVREASTDPRLQQMIVCCTQLSGRELHRHPLLPEQRLSRLGGLTPGRRVLFPQNRLEGLMRASAKAAPGCEVRYGWECFQVDPRGDDGVRVMLQPINSGESSFVRARYLIAADGALSTVRRQLGIGYRGSHRGVRELVAIHFQAQLERWLRTRAAPLVWILHPEAPGVLIRLDDQHGWLFLTTRLGDLQPRSLYTPAHCTQLIRTAVGSDTLLPEIVSIRGWTSGHAIADQLVDGRIALVGDAAHRFHAIGALGLNVGIQGAHGLVWRIARALNTPGAESAHLLDSYETEQRALVARAGAYAAQLDAQLYRAQGLDPHSRVRSWLSRYLGIDHTTVAPTRSGFDLPSRVRSALLQLLTTRARGALRRFADAGRRADAARAQLSRALDVAMPAFADPLGLELGTVYGDPPMRGIDPPERAAGSAAHLDWAQAYRPQLRIGGRLPHVWLRRRSGGARLSSLDLIPYDRFLLLTDAAGAPHWQRAIAALGNADRFPAIALHAIGRDSCDDADRWAQLDGVPPVGGAVLVRPDQHVAWTSARTGDPAAALREALANICLPMPGRAAIHPQPDAVQA
ncbi:MAG: FAD-dependent monooxygenase, partial [Acidobacteriota bacterium]